MKYKKFSAIMFFVVFAAICAGCSTTLEQDVIFSYLAKEQLGRPGIKDVFFNETHSDYKKYRVQPDEILTEDEAPVYDTKKLPKNHFAAENDWMQGLLEALESEDFFIYAKAADNWSMAERFFQSNPNYKQCLILKVGSNVSVAFPPESVLNSGDAKRKKYIEDIKKFEQYVKMYVLTSGIYRTSKVIVGGSIADIRESHERNRENTESDINRGQ